MYVGKHLVAGQTTWYSYDGSSDSWEGSDSSPGLIARVLPDGTTAYSWYRRDQWGQVTNSVETYSSGFGATPLTRTNTYVYTANGIDLARVIGPLGETLAGYTIMAKRATFLRRFAHEMSATDKAGVRAFFS